MAAFIAAQRENTACLMRCHAERWMCPGRGFTSGGAVIVSPRRARRDRLKAEVDRLFAKQRASYGSPRITADLRDAGWRVSKNTVAQ